jgi:hypothetical protein
VFVPVATPVGLYSGTIEILGGDTASAFEVLASRDFAVQVVPEPASVLMVAAAFLGIGLRAIRTRRREN